MLDILLEIIAPFNLLMMNVGMAAGIIIGALECIILSVNNTYMDAGGYAHD